jgi:hypothetical protein
MFYMMLRQAHKPSLIFSVKGSLGGGAIVITIGVARGWEAGGSNPIF